MIGKAWYNFIKFRDAYRERSERFLLSIAEKKWYRVTACGAALFLFARIVDPTVGSVSPSMLARSPSWTVYLGFVVLLPMFAQFFWLRRQANLERYDPDAPEIKRMARRWAVVGFVGATFVVLTFATVIFLSGNLAIFPVWAIAVPMMIGVFIAIIGFQRAGEMRSGLWSPPDWMPPMNSNKPDHDEQGNVE